MRVLAPLPAAPWGKARPACSGGSGAGRGPLRPDPGRGAPEPRGEPPPPLGGGGEEGAAGAALGGEHEGGDPHGPPADDQHRRPTRHGKQLEARETAGGRLRHRRGDGIERPGQRMDAARREENALGKATDTDAAWALAHAPGVALGALTAAIRRLAGDGTPDEVTARAAADPADDSGVLVTEDQGRLPRKEPLGGVDVGAANAGGVDVDRDLPGPGDRIGGLVDREPSFASPGRDLHASRYVVPARFPLVSS